MSKPVVLKDHSDPLATNLYFPQIKRRRSSLHGWGVFAVENINKNKRILHYAGEKILSRDSIEREQTYLVRGEIWCFRINHLYARDGNVNGNLSRFINHACVPNCYSNVIGDTVWIIASRPIMAGEELTYHFHTDGFGDIRCRCRPSCDYEL